MISSNFAIVAALIEFYSAALYANDTLRNRNKPNRVTWALWALAPLVAFSAQVEKGVGLQTALTLAVGLGPLLVLAVSFYNKSAYWKITRADMACGLVSLLALIVLVTTSHAVLALVLSIIADFFAGLPTLRKAWKHPESESFAPFFYAGVGCIITLMTIKHWYFANYSFVIYIFIMDTLIGVSAAGLKKRIFSAAS